MNPGTALGADPAAEPFDVTGWLDRAQGARVTSGTEEYVPRHRADGPAV